MSDFVHLHLHSQYSLLDGANRLDDVIKAAGEAGMPAMAITDHGNMFGAIEFYNKAQEAGIKPIIGMRGLRRPRGAASTARRRRGEQQPPGPAGQERDRLPEPPQAHLDRLPGATTTSRASTRSCCASTARG